MGDASEPAAPALLESLAVIPGVRWYHLADPASPVLDELAAHFGIHPLQVEDCRHRRQTARLEEHEGYTFVVLKVLATPRGDRRRSRNNAQPAVKADAGAAATPAQETPSGSLSPAAAPSIPRLRFEDFDLFLGPDYLLTVDEGHSSLVANVVPRLAAEKPLQSPERIAHALIDAAVDQYLPALDGLGEAINQLEDRVIRNPSPAMLREIFRLKRILLEFRRVATGMREAVNGLVRRYDAPPSTGRKADRELRFYYRDVYDHIVRVIDFVETYRDLLTGSLDIYLSAVANRTNEVMKVLTLLGTIALPLLIITGFYGMNVTLPLQEHPHVLAVLGLLMGGSVAAIVYFFWRQHWF
jgi:magnesium transporter